MRGQGSGVREGAASGVLLWIRPGVGAARTLETPDQRSEQATHTDALTEELSRVRDDTNLLGDK